MEQAESHQNDRCSDNRNAQTAVGLASVRTRRVRDAFRSGQHTLAATSDQQQHIWSTQTVCSFERGCCVAPSTHTPRVVMPSQIAAMQAIQPSRPHSLMHISTDMTTSSSSLSAACHSSPEMLACYSQHSPYSNSARSLKLEIKTQEGIQRMIWILSWSRDNPMYQASLSPALPPPNFTDQRAFTHRSLKQCCYAPSQLRSGCTACTAALLTQLAQLHRRALLAQLRAVRRCLVNYKRTTESGVRFPPLVL